MNRSSGRNPNVHCFPSAVEPEHFAKALDPDLELPADVAALPRPIFGYYGAVDERLDYDLIAALADANAARLGRPGRPDDQGRPRRAAASRRTFITSARSPTPSCPPT